MAVRCSVIIPSYQSAATIRACLTSVLRQDIAEPFEVFVGDSGSDGTAEIIEREFPMVRLLKSAHRLDPAAARNGCAREATGAIFAFIDSDCVAEPDWLRRLCALLDDPRYQGAGGAIRPIDGANAVAWAGYFCEFREFMPGGAAGDATYLTINNAAYRSDTFRAAGGFPEGYFPQEDQVFYRTLERLGARIRLDPSIVVAHTHRTAATAFLRHQVKIGAANARVVRLLRLKGAALVSRRWIAIAVMPALATYRFARTVAACWRHSDAMMLRRPAVAALCWAGQFAWGVGMVRGSAGEV